MFLSRKLRRVGRVPARVWIAGAAILLVALFHNALLERTIEATAGMLTSTKISAVSSQIGLNGATFYGVTVRSNSDEPIAQIERLDVRYDARHFADGRYIAGIDRLDATRPRFAVMRRPDGTFDLPMPPNGSQRSGPLSLILSGTIRDGTLAVADESSGGRAPIYFEHINSTFDIDTSARARYTASLDYREGARRYPIEGSGTADASSRTMMQHWTAALLPVDRIVTFAANDPVVTMQAGYLVGINAIYAGLPAAGGAMDSHLGATAQLRGGRISISPLGRPVRDIAGRFDLSGTAATTNDLSARVGNTHIRFTGGLFDLAHPTLRVAAAALVNLSELQRIANRPALAPMRGSARISALAVGSSTNPTMFASLDVTNGAYGSLHFERAGALAAADSRGVDIIAFHARAASVSLFSAGRAAFAKGLGGVGLMMHAEAPSSALAATGTVLPGMTLSADAVAVADDPTLVQLHGVVAGSSGLQTALGAFDTSSRGIGTFGPLRLGGTLGSAYARGTFDVARRTFSLIATAHRPTLSGALLAQGDGKHVNLAARGSAGGGRIVAYGSLGSGGKLNVAANDLDFGTLRTNGVSLSTGKVSLGATLAGPIGSPHANGAFALAQGSFAGKPIDVSAAFAAENATVRVSDALASFGSALATLDGSVRAFDTAPSYDVAMNVRGADVHDLAEFADPRLASVVDGSVDAGLHVEGTTNAPRVNGTFNAPEGSFNGQAFRSLSGTIAASNGAVSVSNGAISVGSTRATFDGRLTPSSEALSLRAPAVDLADFNDLFDRGDVLAGRGNLDLQVAAAGRRIVSSAGNGTFSNARVLQFPLGNAVARWSTDKDALAMHLAFGAASGRAGVDGSIRLSDYAMNLRAQARGVDLAQWLPLAGAAIPVAVTGRADADVSARGRYPRLDVTARADLRNGSAGRVPIQELAVATHVFDGRGTIDSARLRIAHLDATAAGTYGLDRQSALHLNVRAITPDAGLLASTLLGKSYDASGAVDSTLSIAGTPANPVLSDRLTIDDARYGQLVVPHAAASLAFDRHHLTLQQAEFDLQKGRLTANGSLPIELRNGTYALARGPVAAHVAFDDVELSNFAALLPKQSKLAGRIDGDANVHGTASAPQLSGTLTLADGAYSGPQEETPVSSLTATLVAHGSTIELARLHGMVGSGTLDATGTAVAPSLLDPHDLALGLNVTAHAAQFDLPAYFKGQVDGTIALARTPRSIPSLKGNVSFSHARMPISAFLQASGASGVSKPPSVALDLGLHAGTDVRVQSPNVDVGGTGTIRIAGTLETPRITGRIDATGGTLDFYRNFRLQRGHVTFDPEDGVIPNVSAVATTYISDPQTNVTIGVSGRATDMQLALSSTPGYDRTQILALLAGAQNFASIPGVAATSSSQFSASSEAENLAFGQANQIFTRELLDPLSANLGSALGLANLDLYNDVGEGFGFSARQKLGERLSATGSETFGANRRQDIEVGYHPSDASAVQLHLYQQQAVLFNPSQSYASVGNTVFNVSQSTLPPIDGGGTSGFSFSFERRYW